MKDWLQEIPVSLCLVWQDDTHWSYWQMCETNVYLLKAFANPVIDVSHVQHSRDLRSPNIKQQGKQSWQSYSDFASDFAKQRSSRLFKGSATMPLLEIKCHCWEGGDLSFQMPSYHSQQASHKLQAFSHALDCLLLVLSLSYCLHPRVHRPAHLAELQYLSSLYLEFLLCWGSSGPRPLCRIA